MTERLAVVVPVFNEARIGETLAALYEQQQREDVHHYVVDNASTDDTRARIEAFMTARDDFPLTVLTEEQKGTGAASDTGFRQAISEGYPLVARTDGDTLPSSLWTRKIMANFSADHLQLLGGRTTAIHDDDYRTGDDLLLPMAIWGARAALSIQHRSPQYLKAINGANMATRSTAYERVGGFERSSIHTLDEDINYSLKIAKEFGTRAIRFDSQLRVETSMRRIRQYGIARTALHHLFPGYRNDESLEIDVR